MTMSRNRYLKPVSIAAGLLLGIIGARFLLVPDAAARTFGLARSGIVHELHHMVGLRDLWLSAILIVLVALGEWRAAAVWLLLAAPVCFADAVIAAASSGKAWAVAFHAGSGLVCLALGVAAWRRGPRQTSPRQP